MSREIEITIRDVVDDVIFRETIRILPEHIEESQTPAEELLRYYTTLVSRINYEIKNRHERKRN